MAKVTGLDRLNAKIKRLTPETKKELMAALHKGADELVAMQKRLVEVDSGDLQDSIEKVPGRHELALKVQAGGPKAFYGRWREFGTPNAPASPFFFVAYRALRKRIKSRVTMASTKAAKKVAGNGK